jgi:hypothetical protein
VIATISVGLLLELVWAAALAGVVVAVCFSLVILGSVRAGDLRREGRGVAAALYGVLALIAVAGMGGLIAYGVSIIAR